MSGRKLVPPPSGALVTVGTLVPRPPEVRPYPQIPLAVEADHTGAVEARRDELELESTKQDIKLRKEFARYLLGVHTVVNLSVLVLVFLKGYGLIDLSDRVVVTLIGSTVAELAGLVMVVAKSLFPGKPDQATKRLPAAGRA